MRQKRAQEIITAVAEHNRAEVELLATKLALELKTTVRTGLDDIVRALQMATRESRR